MDLLILMFAYMFAIDISAMYPSMQRDLDIEGARRARDRGVVKKPKTVNFLKC